MSKIKQNPALIKLVLKDGEKLWHECNNYCFVKALLYYCIYIRGIATLGYGGWDLTQKICLFTESFTIVLPIWGRENPLVGRQEIARRPSGVVS